eukprot:5185703-Amphidinium_carterae.2
MSRPMSTYLMAYEFDLLVVGNPATVKPFLEQFKLRAGAEAMLATRQLRHLWSSWASQLSLSKMAQDGTIQLSLSPQYDGKILKPYNIVRCNASTTPGSK